MPAILTTKVQVGILAAGASLARLSNRWNKFSLATCWEGARVAVARRWATRFLGHGEGGLAHRHISISPHILRGTTDWQWFRDATGTAAAFRSGTVQLQAVPLHAFTVRNQVSASQFTALTSLGANVKGKGLLGVCGEIG